MCTVQKIQLRRPRADSGLPAASDDDCAHDYDIASVRTYDDGAVTDDSAIEDMHTPQAQERDRDSGLYFDDHEHDYDRASFRTYARADAAEGGGEAVENNGSAQPHLPPPMYTQPIPRSRTSFDEHDYDLSSSKTYSDDEADDKVGVWEVGVRGRDAAEAAVADEGIVAQLLGLPQPLPQPRTSFDEHDYDLGSTKTYADDEADGEVGVRDAAEAAVADEDIVAQLPQPLPQPRTSFDEHDYDLGSTKTYADDEADGEAVKDGGDSIEDDGAQQAELPGPSQPGIARRRITVWFDEHDYDVASTKTYADDGQDGAAADTSNAPDVVAAVAALSAAMQQAERGTISPSAGQGHHDAGPNDRPPPPRPTTTTWKPVNDKNGRTYYWNTTTNAVSWVNPEAERRDGGVTDDGNRGDSGSHDVDGLARQTMHEADLVDFKAEFVASWSQDKTAGDGDDVSLGLISP